MTRNSNALMRDGFLLAESDLVDFLSGSTDSAINFSGSADLHTPIHPPPPDKFQEAISCIEAEPGNFSCIAYFSSMLFLTIFGEVN